ncbi:hypothetical protein [Mycolicibacterium moriokaense]|uniref:Uncharacterized protein n=1 Tax=Mycolicibacterium moriokaense TaxID=39691 RepID=A0A318HU87_9MYCO|nr:hypothetical protein [Mycolicibacterium moriokaense]PXX11889.1 hypothetical protein C8E89_10213 [Mycolicibacterium moriokaense]
MNRTRLGSLIAASVVTVGAMLSFTAPGRKRQHHSEYHPDQPEPAANNDRTGGPQRGKD